MEKRSAGHVQEFGNHVVFMVASFQEYSRPKDPPFFMTNAGNREKDPKPYTRNREDSWGLGRA